MTTYKIEAQTPDGWTDNATVLGLDDNEDNLFTSQVEALQAVQRLSTGMAQLRVVANDA
jgi:hypothetical protein